MEADVLSTKQRTGGIDPKTITPALSRELIEVAEYFMATMAHTPFVHREKIVVEDVIRGEHDRNGKPLLKRWTVTWADPTIGHTIAGDHDIRTAIMYFLHETDFQEEKIYRNRADICRVLGWSPGKRTYMRIEKACDRLMNVTFTGENVQMKPGEGRYSRIKFRFIDAYGFVDREGYLRRAQQTLPLDYIRISPEFLEAGRQASKKMINLDFYRSLSRPEVKWLYSFADKNLYKKPEYRIGLRKLRRRQGLGSAPDKEIKRQLKTKCEELQKKEFFTYRFVKEGPPHDPWHLVLHPGRVFHVLRGRRGKGRKIHDENVSVLELAQYWRTRKGHPLNGPIDRSDQNHFVDLLSQTNGNVQVARTAIDLALDSFPGANSPSYVLGKSYPQRALKEYQDRQQRKDAELKLLEEQKRQAKIEKQLEEETEHRWNSLQEDDRARIIEDAETAIRANDGWMKIYNRMEPDRREVEISKRAIGHARDRVRKSLRDQIRLFGDS